MSGNRIDIADAFRVVGWRGVVEVLLHPLLVPLLIILSWVRSLWAARILLNGQWGNFQGFHPRNALNSLFYKTQWLNIDRHGLAGTSPTLGLGDFRLSNWFYLSLLSSALYGAGGAAVTLIGSISWVLIHAIWFWVIPWQWVFLVGAALFFSSTAFLMAFVRQNYNIIGWMWLPLALFGTMSNQLGLAAVGWFAASLGSVTAIFVAVPMVTALAVSTGNYYILLVLVPAVSKLGLHLVPLLQHQNLRTVAMNIAKLIGTTRRGTRYVRRSMRIDAQFLYFLGLYVLATACIWYDNGEAPLLVLTALALFVINQVIVRFADTQSVVIVFVSAAAATVVSSMGSLVGLLGLVIAANPLPAAFGGGLWRQTRSLVLAGSFEPFDHSRLRAALDEFLDVQAGSRVLFTFDDPGRDYERIFDGYRAIIELPLFSANRKKIHLLPDWYAVMETNYEGAPDFWGRSPDRVAANADRWEAGYVIVYQDSGSDLGSEWREGFTVVSEFDWADWMDTLGGTKLWTADAPPKWWLLVRRAR